jgi:hypothetical protein
LGLAYRHTTHQLIPRGRRGAYPNEASCQLMKHSIAVFQLRLDGGDRYVAPIIANRWRAVYQLPVCLIGWRLTNKEDPISYLNQLNPIQKEETNVHHQISPLSLLSRSLDPLGIVEPLELLLISTPIFLDYVNRYFI